MDLAKRKADLETARERCAAQLNAILGQLQLVDELLAEKPTPIDTTVAPVATNGAGVPIECAPDADDDA